MKVIGITGGVGCGKSTVLNFLEEKYNCRILKSDDAARILEEPGGECYTPMVRMLEETSLPGEDPERRLTGKRLRSVSIALQN